MTTNEAAYLAGLFDGEGCLAVRIGGRGACKSPSPSLVFVLGLTHKPTLDWIKNVVGRGHLVRASDKGRRLPYWRFQLTTQRVLLRLLYRLEPFCITKQPRVRMAIEFLRSRAERQHRAGYSRHELRQLYGIRVANYGVGEKMVYKGKALTFEDFYSLVMGHPRGYVVVEWTPEMDSLVGTDIDRSIAKRLGLKLAQVQRRRAKLGIPPFGSVHEGKTRQILELRRQGETLTRIAALVGVSTSSVHRVLARDA